MDLAGCRMYQKEYPDVDDLVVAVVSQPLPHPPPQNCLSHVVIWLGAPLLDCHPHTLAVQVKSIDEMGAYVKLLEYNDVEGMILMTELSRRRIRSINKLLRIGKQEVVMVLRVDKERGAYRAPRSPPPPRVQNKALTGLLRRLNQVISTSQKRQCPRTTFPRPRRDTPRRRRSASRLLQGPM